MRPDQIAINTVSLADAPLDEIVAACAAAGFKLIEFPLPRVKAWMTNGRGTEDVAALLDRHGLRCVGGFEAPVACFAADDAARQKNHALHVANAELLASLGGGTLVVGTDGPAQGKPVEALDVVGQTLAGLVERFPTSVSVAVEFNWSPLVKSLRSAAAVVRAAGHDRVGILFDPAHYHCTPSKLDDLTPGVIGMISHVHVNDMRDVPGDLSDCNADRVLPGAGILDLRGLIGRLDGNGYNGTYSIELFNKEIWQLPPADAARRCYQAMMTLAGEG